MGNIGKIITGETETIKVKIPGENIFVDVVSAIDDHCFLGRLVNAPVSELNNYKYGDEVVFIWNAEHGFYESEEKTDD